MWSQGRCSWISLQPFLVFATAAWCQPGGVFFFPLARPPRKCAKVQNAPSGATLIAADGPRRPEKLHVALVADWMIFFGPFSGEAKVVRITSVAEVQNNPVNPVLPGQEKWPWMQSDANWYSWIVMTSGAGQWTKKKVKVKGPMWLRYVGRIKSFSQETGYGFITCDETQCPQLGGHANRVASIPTEFWSEPTSKVQKVQSWRLPPPQAVGKQSQGLDC